MHQASSPLPGHRKVHRPMRMLSGRSSLFSRQFWGVKHGLFQVRLSLAGQSCCIVTFQRPWPKLRETLPTEIVQVEEYRRIVISHSSELHRASDQFVLMTVSTRAVQAYINSPGLFSSEFSCIFTKYELLRIYPHVAFLSTRTPMTPTSRLYG